MSGRNESKLFKARSVAALLCVAILSSCASAGSVQDKPPEAPTSEAALLDDSEKAMPVVEPGGGVDMFSDLKPAPNAAAADPSSPFYNPIGGETLGRVAYTLYGDRNKKQELLQLNPDLKRVKSLTADQNVYFDFANVNPEPTFLTKGLIDRYASQLAEKVSNKALTKSDVVVGSGETLQMVSQRLYGTTRYWTEIYLLNHDKLGNYDKVAAGMSLTVYERAGDGLAKVGAPAVPSQSIPPELNEQAPPASAQASTSNNNQIDNQAAPNVATQSAQAPAAAESPLPFDPIPETPPTPASATTAPAPVTPAQQVQQKAPEIPKPVAVAAEKTANNISSSIAGNSNYRRMLYMGLIILIAGAAFFLTRPANKKKFDMLDATATETAASRPKLAKDNHDLFVG